MSSREAVNSTKSQIGSALCNTLFPVLDTMLGMLCSLKVSESDVLGRRYNKRKMSIEKVMSVVQRSEGYIES